MFTIDMKGKVVWITGGSRGIGREIALTFAKAGADIALIYRSQHEAAAEVQKEIHALDVRCEIRALDVGDIEAVREAHKDLSEKLGKFQVVVNNAGIVRDKLFLTMDTDDWRQVIDTNLLGVVNVTQVLTRDFMMQRHGRIINLSSVAATKGGRGQANYAASKAAIEGMTRSLAVELGSRNITANCIAPGVIETDMSKDVREMGSDLIMDRQVIKRFGQTSDIAPWALFLASDHGAYVTGQTITIDGGHKMP